MKSFCTASCLLFLLVVATGIAQSGDKKSKKEPIAWPADKIQWVDLKDVPGARIAPLWGDMMKGAYSVFAKLPAGDKHPLHHHTNDVKAVVMSGTFLYTPEGGTEVRLGPGSYLFIPAGVMHSSGTDGETVLFQEGPGMFDLVPAKQTK